MKKILTILSLLLSLFITNAANAQTSQCSYSDIDTAHLKTYQAGNTIIGYDGLVPCGKCSLVGISLDQNGNYLAGTGLATEIPCQLCHTFVMIKGIFDFLLLQIVPLAAVLLFTIGGLMFLISRGNPSQITQGKNIITSVAVGLVIIFASWLIINTVFTFIGLAEWTGNLKDGWFQVNCSINLPS
jgi:hypothetical protein